MKPQTPGEKMTSDDVRIKMLASKMPEDGPEMQQWIADLANAEVAKARKEICQFAHDRHDDADAGKVKGSEEYLDGWRDATWDIEWMLIQKVKYR